jgi:hypothetical protein
VDLRQFDVVVVALRVQLKSLNGGPDLIEILSPVSRDVMLSVTLGPMLIPPPPCSGGVGSGRSTGGAGGA